MALLFAILHMVLASLYVGATPYRTAGVLFNQKDPSTGGPAPAKDIGAPDERQHANYIQRIIDGKGFPVFEPKDPNLYETYQSHQPPLFYVAAATYSKAVGVSNVDDPSVGGKLRAFNVVVGGLNVAAIFLLAYFASRRRLIAIIAAGLAATLPMNCALSGALSNDPLLFLFCSLALAGCSYAISSFWCLRKALIVGLCAGLALLTKTTALALFPAILIAVLTRGKFDGQRASFKVIAVIAALAILLPLPWWIRNQQLYGDPFALRVFTEAFTGTAQTKDMVAGFGASNYWLNMFGWWTMRSFFGVFGYMDLFLNETKYALAHTGPDAPNAVYRLFMALLALVSLGYVAFLGRNKAEKTLATQWPLLAFTFFVAAQFLKFNLVYFQAQGRYLLPALGPIALFWSYGLLELVGVFTRSSALQIKRTTLAVAGGVLVLGCLVTDIKICSWLPDQFALRQQAAAGRSP